MRGVSEFLERFFKGNEGWIVIGKLVAMALLSLYFVFYKTQGELALSILYTIFFTVL